MTDIKKYAVGVGSYTNLNTETICKIATAKSVLVPNKPREITYRTNEYGFRLDPSINHETAKRAAFGCSQTFGVELEVELTWANLIGAANFGVAGSSIQTVARLIEAWIPISNVETVFVIIPESSRRELYSAEMNAYSNIHTNSLLQLSQMIYRTEITNLQDSYAAIGRLCKEYPEVNVLDGEQNKIIQKECIERIQHACDGRELIMKDISDLPDWDWGSRDGAHNGELWHRKVAQLFERAIV